MTGDLLKCNVLATHTIANVSETLARKLELPERLSAGGLLDVLNALMSRDEFMELQL